MESQHESGRAVVSLWRLWYSAICVVASLSDPTADAREQN